MRLEPFWARTLFRSHGVAARDMPSASDCESLSIGELPDMVPVARPELEAQRLGYTRGRPAPRSSVRRSPGSTRMVGAEGVLVHNGASETIFILIHAALGPGGAVIVHYPCYLSLYQRSSPHDRRPSR